MSGGAFPPLARTAILEAAGWRCVGCGRSDPLTCQHRRARGMGGTSRDSIGEAVNGVALCGSGTTGCHGWAESRPLSALALGWRLGVADDPLKIPYWTRYGWRLWAADLTVSSLTEVVAAELLGGDVPGLAEVVASYERHVAIGVR